MDDHVQALIAEQIAYYRAREVVPGFVGFEVGSSPGA
jgi:hypothetical protein